MSVSLAMSNINPIMDDILHHPAWHGEIRGLQAEKQLREWKKPFLYLLRAGEKTSEYESDYYVSFILPDLSIKHQPFIITATEEGWYFENGGGGGPYIEEAIDDVLHLIMHCQREECIPLTKIK